MAKMHKKLSNACLNCVASFKSLACIIEEELHRQEQHHVTSCATYWAKNFYVIKRDIILQKQVESVLHVYCRGACGDKNIAAIHKAQK